MILSAVPLGASADDETKELFWNSTCNRFTGTEGGQYDWSVWYSAKNEQFTSYAGKYKGSFSAAKGVFGRSADDGSIKVDVSVDSDVPTYYKDPDTGAVKSAFLQDGSNGICNVVLTNWGDKFGTYKGTNYLHMGVDIALDKIENTAEDANVEMRAVLLDADGNQRSIHLLGFYNTRVIKLAGKFTRYYIEPQKWTRFDFVFNRKTNTVDAYINGTVINRNVPITAADGKAFSMDSDKGGFQSFRIYALDPKNATADGEKRTNSIYVDDIGYDFMVNPYDFNYRRRDGSAGELYSDVSYKQIAKMSGTDLELSNPSYPNLADTDKGILYASDGMTAEKVLSGLNAPEGAECMIIQEREVDGDWRGYNELSGSDKIASDKHNNDYNEIRETFVKVSVPNSEGVAGRVYYYPIADAKLVKCTNNDGEDVDALGGGMYSPGDVLNFEVLSSADNSTYTVVAAQYSTDGKLIKCRALPVNSSSVKTPAVLSFTTEDKGSETGAVKLYLWNAKMAPFREVKEYTAVPAPDSLISTDAVDNLTIDNSARTIEAYGQDIESLTANLRAAAPAYQYK